MVGPLIVLSPEASTERYLLAGKSSTSGWLILLDCSVVANVSSLLAYCFEVVSFPSLLPLIQILAWLQPNAVRFHLITANFLHVASFSVADPRLRLVPSILVVIWFWALQFLLRIEVIKLFSEVRLKIVSNKPVLIQFLTDTFEITFDILHVEVGIHQIGDEWRF